MLDFQLMFEEFIKRSSIDISLDDTTVDPRLVVTLNYDGVRIDRDSLSLSKLIPAINRLQQEHNKNLENALIKSWDLNRGLGK